MSVSPSTGRCEYGLKRIASLFISNPLHQRVAFEPSNVSFGVPRKAPTAVGAQHLGQRRFGLHTEAAHIKTECPPTSFSTGVCIHDPILPSDRVLGVSSTGSFQFLTIGFDEAYPLWAISSGGSGGMDWTIQEVGQVWDTYWQACALAHISLRPLVCVLS